MNADQDRCSLSIGYQQRSNTHNTQSPEPRSTDSHHIHKLLSTMKLSASSLILSLLLSKGALANEHSSLLQPDAIGESSPKSKAFRIFPPPKLGRSTPEDCPEESGYEVWRQLPPKDAKLRFEGIVDCDTQTYTLTLSFVPDMVRSISSS